jgi:murein DD-endopeptidase MepM/ murein hydrolase activator NlpD
MGLSVVAITMLASPTSVPATLPIDRFDAPAYTDDCLTVIDASASEAPRARNSNYVIAPRGKALNWVHPLVGHGELPSKGSRRFGAVRPREPRSECGGGHCGVDLGGRVGTPVIAALDAVVMKVNRDASRSGGRYVVLKHKNGLESEYMHLNRIDRDLQSGQMIPAGTYLGTLGTTGIHHSEPHLHFAVSHVKRNGERRYLDPEPMLERARVVAGRSR